MDVTTLEAKLAQANATFPHFSTQLATLAD